jgi:hypothetical protein
MQTQKGSATVIVFIALLLTLGGTVWYFNNFSLQKLTVTTSLEQPQTEEIKKVATVSVVEKNTANTNLSSWKTYKSKGNNFTVQYPSNWFVEERPIPPLTSFVAFSNVQKSNGSREDEASFRIFFDKNGNPDNLAIESWYAEFAKGGFPSEPLSKIVTAVGGKPAIRIAISDIGTGFIYYFVDGSDAIEIDYPTQQPDFVDIYTKMLSTFEFVK